MHGCLSALHTFWSPSRAQVELDFDRSIYYCYIQSQADHLHRQTWLCPTELRKIDTQALGRWVATTIVRRKWRHVSTRTWADDSPIDIRLCSRWRQSCGVADVHRPEGQKSPRFACMVSGLAGWVGLGAAAARTKQTVSGSNPRHRPAGGRGGWVGGCGLREHTVRHVRRSCVAASRRPVRWRGPRRLVHAAGIYTVAIAKQ
jgi:hypothetical protein